MRVTNAKSNAPPTRGAHAPTIPTHRHDQVIIAGAGPAGATAAYYLTSRGLRVAVLDKSPLDRAKACGGGVAATTLRCFPFALDSECSCVPVTSVRYSLGGRSETAVDIPGDRVFTVDRAKFDCTILKNAKGAVVLENTQVSKVVENNEMVQVETMDGKILRGRFLIGADGSTSRVAKIVNMILGVTLPIDYAPAMVAEVPVSPEVHKQFSSSALFGFGYFRYGYAWIFPRPFPNVCIGVATSQPSPGELWRVLRKLADRHGIVLEQGKCKVRVIPVFNSARPVATDRILLAGDAAGLVDPLTGEGIRLAIQSGKMAASAIIEACSELSHTHAQASQTILPTHIVHTTKKNPEQMVGPKYSKRVRQQLMPSLTVALWVSHLFYAAPWWCFTIGACNPVSTHAYIHLISGRIGYITLCMFLLSTLPLCILVECGLLPLLLLVVIVQLFSSLLHKCGLCNSTIVEKWGGVLGIRHRLRGSIYSLITPFILWPYIIMHGIVGYFLSRVLIF
ncbi:geranylgeranyl reductase family protein [Pelomyxa schiedti]|nr:geranylgeranyl reductase family protein [Pelomyxa schiedti]